MAATPKPGDWIILTRDGVVNTVCPTHDLEHGPFPEKMLIKKGTPLKIKGHLSLKLRFEYKNMECSVYRSSIKYKIVSPKKHKFMEALYGV